MLQERLVHLGFQHINVPRPAELIPKNLLKAQAVSQLAYPLGVLVEAAQGPGQARKRGPRSRSLRSRVESNSHHGWRPSCQRPPVASKQQGTERRTKQHFAQEQGLPRRQQQRRACNVHRTQGRRALVNVPWITKCGSEAGQEQP